MHPETAPAPGQPASQDASVERVSQEIVLQEMRHRLRNAYAISGAIALASARETPEHKDFAASLARRFSSLSVVQSLMGEGGAGEKLEDLVTTLIQAYDPDADRITLSRVPSLVLDEQQARLIGLAVGELCTNSLRHGALGGTGSVALGLGEEDGFLVLSWDEVLAAPVEPPVPGKGSGFGLLRRMAQVHRGGFTVDFAGANLLAKLKLPLAG